MEINLQNVINLLDRAEGDLDDSLNLSPDKSDNGSTKALRSGAFRGSFAKGFDTAKGFLADLVSGKDKQSDTKSMSTVINCVVKVLSSVSPPREKSSKTSLMT